MVAQLALNNKGLWLLLPVLAIGVLHAVVELDFERRSILLLCNRVVIDHSLVLIPESPI